MNLQSREIVKRHLREAGLADKAQSPEIVAAIVAAAMRVADAEFVLIDWLRDENSRPTFKNADEYLDDFSLNEFDRREYLEIRHRLWTSLHDALRDELTRRGFTSLVARPEVLDSLVSATGRAAFEIAERACSKGGER